MPIVFALGPIITAVASTAAAAGTAVAGAAAAAGTAAAGAAAAAGTAAAAAAGTAATAATAAGTAAVGAIGSTAAGAAALEAVALASTAVGSAASAAAATSVGGAVASAATSVAGAVTTTVATLGTGGVATVISGATIYTGNNIVSAFANFDEADELIAQAKREFKAGVEKLDAKKNETVEKLENLNILKLEIYSGQVKNAIDLFKKISSVKEKNTDFLDVNNIDKTFTAAEIKELDQITHSARDVLDQVDRGVGLMRAASTGSLAFMAQFGIASTGTAISSLSGAAATNATLAALGGGSLATGGGGMALGNVVLGGITVVPAAMVLSWKYAKKSEQALTKAHANYANTKKEIAKMDLQVSVLRDGIDQRIDEIYGTLTTLSSVCSEKILPRLYAIYEANKGVKGKVNYNACHDDEKTSIKLAAHFVRELTNVMRVKMLDEAGNPSDASSLALQRIASDPRLESVA